MEDFAAQLPREAEPARKHRSRRACRLRNVQRRDVEMDGPEEGEVSKGQDRVCR